MGHHQFVWWIVSDMPAPLFPFFPDPRHMANGDQRAAEAMTVVAVGCAALFPCCTWDDPGCFSLFSYPIPGTAVGHLYSPFSGLCCHFGLFADLRQLLVFRHGADFATIRDTTTSKIKRRLRLLFLRMDGSSKEWLRFEALSFVLGGIAAVLVVSVHSIVSTDFAVSVEPGWHTTIFPPYFVVGAIFSGFAMVLTLVTLMRKLYKMDDFITDAHVDAVCRVLIFISLIMGTAYLTEIFMAWYSGSNYEMYTFFKNRIFGEYAFQFWAMVHFQCPGSAVVLV